MTNQPTRPTLGARAQYGLRVVSRAFGVISSRARPAPIRSQKTEPFNTMFDATRLDAFCAEKQMLASFDTYLFEAMHAARLQGQIVFEYGTLVRAVDRWKGLRVLDIGTGRSTLPKWMSAQGADVTSFDLAAPVERPLAGFQERVDSFVARRHRIVRTVAGTMRQLPFADSAFDLVTSLSVLEHLDTDLPGRAYVEYGEQRQRLAQALDEMVRVTSPGGRLYITSDCCDFSRATSDAWRDAYYYVQGPALSGAWPVHDVPEIFYEYLGAHGCALVGGCHFDPHSIADPSHWTFRGPFFSGFSVLARRDGLAHT
jgi:SAM-dependent methyltransferase